MLSVLYAYNRQVQDRTYVNIVVWDKPGRETRVTVIEDWTKNVMPNRYISTPVR